MMKKKATKNKDPTLSFRMSLSLVKRSKTEDLGDADEVLDTVTSNGAVYINWDGRFIIN